MQQHIKDEIVTLNLNYPHVDAAVFSAPMSGIPYLRECGVALIGQTATHLSGVKSFLRGFNQGYEEYLNDPGILDPGSLLCKFAGQLCYLSLSDKRTKNDAAAEYFTNIKKQKHGSVIEHPVYTFLFYGIDRAVTHELVRHRVGKAYSQVSQRYVGPKDVRYVMPTEMQGDTEMENIFFEDIADNRARYAKRIEKFAEKLSELEGETKTDKRKRMQSFARRCLANEVEAPIIMSGNARSWRHVFTMRTGSGADIAIRRPTFTALKILQRVNKTAFDDFDETRLNDGSWCAKPTYEKV